MGKLLFGWAEISITPDKKISLAGQFAERISEYVEKPLTATALAIQSGNEQAVLCSADIVSVGYSLVDAVRERLKENGKGLDPGKVTISAIHTHTGPNYPRGGQQLKYAGKTMSPKGILSEMLPPGKKYVEKVNVSDNKDIMAGQEMLDFLADRISEVILNAWDNRREGSFVNAFGRAAVGMCRRVTYNDGSAQMWGDTNTATFEAVEGGSDTGIELMYFFGENKELVGVIANLACPAQCVQHRMFISPDFWGEAKMLLRKRFGEKLYLLPLCSAAGDQCPVDLVRWVEPESDVNDPNMKRTDPPKRKADPSMFDIAGMKKAGKRVANEITEVYEEGLDEPISDAEFKHVVCNFKLPLRRTTLTEIKAAEKAIKEYLNEKEGDVDYNDAANLQVYLGILRRAKIQEVMEVVDTEAHIIRLGNTAFATNPFELFLDYGNQIKARSLAEQTFIAQLTNGAEGYLPTEKAEKGGHYSAFISSGQVGHAGGELLVRETLKEINDLFKK
ncbi:MAG: hypothetical protein IJS65_01465 [Clostridia bacterium]|nr:hypothetical protein [Clostridia bacterium]